MAAVNIGHRPTFETGENKSVLEAHLIGFNGDIYGESGRVEFVDFLREERQFDGIDSLKQQLESDIRTVEELLRAD
tara:strand:- start:893 stop:1120 length:228 start_codon:yes stop_codon:yes gene_type:complete